MIRSILIAATVGLVAISAGEVSAAPKAKAPYPMAADGTTNIADCPKVDIKYRNECISRSRPVTGNEIYAQAAAKPAKVKAEKVKAEKIKKPAPAAVAGAPKGFKIGKDGTTNISDCVKAAPAVRNECISRARPLTAKELAKFNKQQTAATAKVEAKPAAKKVVAAPAPAVVGAKGFAIAKDGTTDINDCAKAKPEFRNECISRARPLTAEQLAKFGTQQTAVSTPETKPAAKKAEAAPAPAPAVVALKGFPIAKDGTTDINDCAKAKPEFRNECISRSRPVSGTTLSAVKPKS